MMREDLLRLTDAQLASLGNVGLLSRARREVDKGRGPSLELTDRGLLIARSPDGAESRLDAGASEILGTCTCGAPRACRHRLAAILQYQAANAGEVEEGPWCPSTFEDAALLAYAGPRRMAAAEAARAATVAVRVNPGETPSAELEGATVAFWARDALHMARCDCGQAPCAHVVLAVWAFRAHPEPGLVVLGEGEREPASGPVSPALARVEPTLEELLRVGLASLEGTSLFVQARSRLEEAGHVWMRDAFEDLERAKERYDRQSAVFRPELSTRHVAELAARTRAASAPSPALPTSLLLGVEEGASGRIDRLRLLGLGARVEADGSRRLVSAYFAEPISMTVLALRYERDFEDEEAPVGAGVGALFPSSRRSLAELAANAFVARGARRRANGLLDLSRARSIQPSSAAGGAWDELAAPILVTHLEALAERRAKEPPSLLGPRLVGRDVQVLRFAEVEDLGYSSAHQEVVALVRDEAGVRCRVRAEHRHVSPARLDTLYRALTEGAHLVSGHLAQTSLGWTLTPLAIVERGGRVVVPDLEAPRPVDKESRPELFDAETESPLFAELEALATRGVHRGYPSVRASLEPLASRFDAAGLGRTARLVRRAHAEGVRGFLDLVVASAFVPEVAP